MKPQYAEITIEREPAGWRFSQYSSEFLHMTDFTHDTLETRFGGHFMRMLSATDMPTADELFANVDGRAPLCPWVFTLSCAGERKTLSVLLQPILTQDQPGKLHVRVHDASFLGGQTAKMSDRMLSLENSIACGLCEVLINDELTILWHNELFLQALGYTEDQFIHELGCKAIHYIHPDDVANIQQKLREATEKNQRVFTCEMRVIRRDGTIVWILTSFSFTEETVGGVPVLYSMGVDITDQRRAHELELDAERLRLAMDQISSYIFEYDVINHSLLASKSLEKHFGIIGDAENIPEALIESGAIAEGSVQTTRRLFREIEMGEGNVQGEICLHTTSSPEECWFRIRLTPILSDTGRVVKAVLLAEDITEHYRIEMRFRAEETRRVAMTYDMSFSCQFDLTEGRVLSVSEEKFPFFDRAVSDSCTEFVRHSAVKTVHPEDRAEYLRHVSIEYMMGLFEHGVPEMTIDFRALGADGAYRWRRGLAHVIREPERGHICAYIYTRDIDEEKAREFELRRHAEQDALTGLLNRYTVELCCDRQLEQHPAGDIAALYMLDLDNFKHLNDTYGHFRGDEVLCQAAQALRGLFGADAFLGRLGGDEFVVLEPNCTSTARAGETAQRICDGLRALASGADVVSSSIGIAFAPRDGRTFAELYHCADNALYQAKRSGKNRWAFYDPAAEMSDGGTRLPVSREWLLEESSDIIYVCDFYSYDLLYLNSGARALFGVGDRDYVGKKCYELLQHCDHPCAFCTNHLLCREQFYSWEYRNEVLGHSFLLRDRIVDWYGVPARIEFATDISAVDQRNQALARQAANDQTVLASLRAMTEADTPDEALAAMLAYLAQFYGADRAYLLEYNAESNLLKPRGEWAAERLRSLRDLMGEGEKPSEYMRQCFRDHADYQQDSGDLRDKAGARYSETMRAMGVTSRRGVPLYAAGRPVGLLGVDNPTSSRDDLTVLQTLAYFLSAQVGRT